MRGSRGGAGGGSVSGDGKGGSTNGAGMGSIPATSRKMVQSLKEIVNCPELEIYAMLKECNMDPNETVNRLLSQDPFHEVKKKREKKKENKDTTDSRFRGINSNSSRAGRSGADRHSRAAAPAPQFGISDTGSSRSSRLSYKKDNGAAYSSAAHGVVENNVNWQPPILSETPYDSKLPTANTSNVTSVHSTPSFQSAWSGVPGQVSMADIVRRGRPHGKAHVSHQITDQHVLGSLQPSPTPNEWRSAQNNSTRASENVPDSRIGENHHAPPSDGWDVDEQPPASNIPYTSEAVAGSEPYTAQYDAALDKSNNQQQPSNELHYMEDGGADNTEDSRNILDNSQDANDDELYEEMHSYPSHQHGRVQQEDDEVAGDMQQLNLSKEEEEEDEDEEVEDSPRENHSPAVKIPDHLQVQSADCSHLSFGSFGSGMADPFAGPVGSKPAQSDVEGTFAPVEEQPMGHSDASNTEYYGNEDLRDASDEHVGHGLAANAADGYDMPASSQPETSRQESSEVSAGNEYSFASSSANYGFENNQALDVLSHSQANSHMENLPQQLGATAYPSSLPSNLLTSSVQQPREVDHSYSPFSINQSTPDKYGGNVSISGSAISMTEALKTGNLSHAQLSQNPSSGSNLSGGSGLPQQLAMPSYSQPSVPFAAANMMGYPFMPQNYTYMPQSAFQQGFPAGSSSYHQTLAAMLPQYKNSVSVQQSGAAAALASGYGGFGSSSNVPGGNFSLNSSGVSSVAAAPPPPAASSISYEDLLRAQQYKEAAHLLALQQQVQGGPGSRTMSAVPPNTYYGYQGQTQHQQQPPAGGAAAGYRQVQQAPPPQMHSQHYGNLGGYPSNFYAAGNLQLEQHHQQMLREGSQGVQQLQASQVKQQQQQQPQHQQMWQNNY